MMNDEKKQPNLIKDQEKLQNQPRSITFYHFKCQIRLINI